MEAYRLPQQEVAMKKLFFRYLYEIPIVVALVLLSALLAYQPLALAADNMSLQLRPSRVDYLGAPVMYADLWKPCADDTGSLPMRVGHDSINRFIQSSVLFVQVAIVGSLAPSMNLKENIGDNRQGPGKTGLNDRGTGSGAYYSAYLIPSYNGSAVLVGQFITP